jgi:hypothetical protein
MTAQPWFIAVATEKVHNQCILHAWDLIIPPLYYGGKLAYIYEFVAIVYLSAVQATGITKINATWKIESE